MALEAMKLDRDHRVRMLTQEEVHQKIELVTAEVLGAAAAAPGDGPMEPRIISAADLVRRMKPFMVYN